MNEGIFKTTNANADDPKWNILTGDLPITDFTRIALGISKSSPSTLYALMSNIPPNWVIDKFYQTKDSGKNWKRVTIDVPPSRHNSDHDFGGQGFYNMNVAVHPKNENIVYLSLLIVMESSFRWEQQCEVLKYRRRVSP